MRVKIRILGLIILVVAAFLIINGEIVGANTRFIGFGGMILGICLIAAVSQSKGYD